MVGAVKSAQKCNNLNYLERNTIRSLRNDENIIIAKADKGNTTVVLNKDYDQKVKSHLNDENIYRKLPENNIKSLQRKVNGTLLDMKKKKYFSREEYEKLYSSSAVTPSFYGLIKIHKEGNPIRPIVSFCSSPMKFLSCRQKLSPL